VSGGSSYGVPEYVDKVAVALLAHVVEHCLKAPGGTQVYSTDHCLGVASDGQLDAPTILRVRCPGHQSCANQPIDHRAGSW
jgi:hypothetical protein